MFAVSGEALGYNVCEATKGLLVAGTDKAIERLVEHRGCRESFHPLGRSNAAARTLGCDGEVDVCDANRLGPTFQEQPVGRFAFEHFRVVVQAEGPEPNRVMQPTVHPNSRFLFLRLVALAGG
jgi:hypothetical protein